ncbi:MAG TPA: DASS family sodium-coupled anion symporter [Candidatus Polarisedimenticolaceae bacterium]|nr:DASS family sodium-coupled anion symporter [Candidatus Polarisedimenticolaceae bacterium]
MAGGRRIWIARTAVIATAAALWFSPVPDGLSAPAWHLFALFAGAIFAVVAGALPILTASLIAAALAVLTGTLAPAHAFGGFSNGTILLIVVAFLVARAVVTTGLGQRIGYGVVALFGRSTLGLAYSVFVVDALIAPAFPSNTARSGVLFPLTYSLAEAAGAEPAQPARRRLGAFLMFSGIASLSVSSGLWLTAMAANPVGAEIAKPFGVSIGFGSWLIAASVPSLVAMGVLPPLLFAIFRPEVRSTPEAPAAAKKALAAMGPLRRSEKIVAVTFVAMVVLWAAGGRLGIDATAVAFAGLAVLLVTGVLTPSLLAKEGDVLAVYLWFAILFTLSSQLNELGFMAFLGERLASHLGGLAPGVAGVVLVVAYVALHYLFVSQTAHLLALFGVFLDVGVRLGVPAAPLAFLLLFATNFFSSLTPQASSANLLFAGSGYLSQGEMYRAGAATTGACLVVFLAVGLPWLMWVTR